MYNEYYFVLSKKKTNIILYIDNVKKMLFLGIYNIVILNHK